MIILNTKNYKDKYTGERQSAGTEREVTAERGRAIIKAGFAVEKDIGTGADGDNANDTADTDGEKKTKKKR